MGLSEGKPTRIRRFGHFGGGAVEEGERWVVWSLTTRN